MAFPKVLRGDGRRCTACRRIAARREAARRRASRILQSSAAPTALAPQPAAPGPCSAACCAGPLLPPAAPGPDSARVAPLIAAGSFCEAVYRLIAFWCVALRISLRLALAALRSAARGRLSPDPLTPHSGVWPARARAGARRPTATHCPPPPQPLLPRARRARRVGEASTTARGRGLRGLGTTARGRGLRGLATPPWDPRGGGAGDLGGGPLPLFDGPPRRSLGPLLPPLELRHPPPRRRQLPLRPLRHLQQPRPLRLPLRAPRSNLRDPHKARPPYHRAAAEIAAAARLWRPHLEIFYSGGGGRMPPWLGRTILDKDVARSDD